jgi:putative redox protein
VSDADERAVVARTGAAGFETTVRIRQHDLRIDEPAAQGGADTGPTPSELVAAALASCTTITLRMYADRKGWPLEAVEVGIDRRIEPGARSPGGRARPRYVRTLRLTGPLDESQVARLLDIADRCPVHRQLAGGSDITTELIG